MTIYFRPDRIEYSYPTKSNDSFKDDQENYNITLDLAKIVDGKSNILIDYHLDEVNFQFLNKGKFIGIAARGKYSLQITHRSHRVKEEGREKLTVILDFSEEIEKFKGCKNDIFSKEIHIGDYVIFCSYGYNKFIEVCGMSKFYEFTIEPSGIIEEKMKKINHDTFISATKGLNQQQTASKIVERPSEIKGEERSMYIEEQRREVRVSEKSSENVRMPVQKQKNLQKNESKVDPSSHQSSKIKEDLTFYKGACKTSNFFSCLDPRANIDKKYNFIEQSYD